MQIVHGLLCAPDGCPVAIEVFEGNTADPRTLAAQVDKLEQRFQLGHVVLVGDRGMIAQARDHRGHRSGRPGLDLGVACPGDQGPGEQWRVATHVVRPARYGLHHLARLPRRASGGVPQSPTSPHESGAASALRPACRHRGFVLSPAFRQPSHARRDPLRGTAEIALAVGAVINRHKMAKHFALDISDTSFSFARKDTEIAAEAATDGIYIVRTSLPETRFDDATTVRSYKSLALVERAFRCIKTVDLQVRPVYHWLADRVRAHVFLCMLAYHLEWHMRQRLAPMLFDDTDQQAAEALRTSVVAQAQRSPAAVTKQTTGLTPDGLPVHSFRSLLADLATLARNTVTTDITPNYPITVLTRPTAIQHKAFALLAVTCSQ